VSGMAIIARDEQYITFFFPRNFRVRSVIMQLCEHCVLHACETLVTSLSDTSYKVLRISAYFPLRKKL
jgi:hypothetical protein